MSGSGTPISATDEALMNFSVNEQIIQVHFPPTAEVKEWLAQAPPGLPLFDLCQAIPEAVRRFRDFPP